MKVGERQLWAWAAVRPLPRAQS